MSEASPLKLVTEKRVVSAKLAVVQADNKILLLRRSDADEYRPGTFDLPGGEKKKRETLILAAVRELKEETGLVCSPWELRPAAVLRAVSSYGHKNTRHFYTAQLTQVNPEIVLNPDEHSDYAWFDPEEAVAQIEHPVLKMGLLHCVELVQCNTT
jgi:8-oxo-dGTP diphosphatase